MTIRISYWVITFMLAVSLVSAFEGQAHAYVDPGSGLLALQGVSAALTGVLFYFRRKIKRLFMGLPDGASGVSSDAPAVPKH